MGALEPWHLILILVIVLIIFGPGKLPSIGRAVGDSIRELRHATGGGETSSAAPGATVAPTTTVERVCRQCRTAVPPGNRFCGVCGEPI